MKTHLVASALAGLFAVSGHALVCDKTFFMQSARQVILKGSSTASMELDAAASKDLDASLSGVEVLYPPATYEVMTRWEGAGACTDFKLTKVDYARRDSGQGNFRTVTASDVNVLLSSGPYAFKPTLETDWWFAFARKVKPEPAEVFEAVAKVKGATKPHQWYGNALAIRKVINAGVGTTKYTLTEGYPELNSNADSADLVNLLLRGWKDYKSNDTQVVSLRVQLIKVTYDSIAPQTSLRPGARARNSGFQAGQTGSMVFIQPGEKAGPATEALGVYNMMGHRVATLHPTGYLYQWNGRTAAGAEAPTGVYFVQSGNRILGKFFFTR